MLTELLVVVAAALIASAAATACSGPGGCCYPLSFNAGPGYRQFAERMPEGFQLTPTPDNGGSPWEELAGIRFEIDPGNSNPISGQPYALALLNLSAPLVQSQPWNGLYSPSVGLALTAATSAIQAPGGVQPLR